MTDGATTMEHIVNGPLHPSDLQEQVLAFLPIPSAILSVFGSVAIIYMICNCRKATSPRQEQLPRTHQRKKLTPYLRLLLGMSIYDILSSLNWSVAAFLRPSSTSLRMLSIGNTTTCNIVGLVNQLSHSTMIYMGMLSFYFLLTARYHISNQFIARFVEPWMHIIAIGYPLIFAILGQVLLGGYGEVTQGMGCWLVATPNCADDFWCTSRILSWVSYAFPLIIVCIALIVNNAIIFAYARKQIRPKSISCSKSFSLNNNSSASIRLYSERSNEAVDWQDGNDSDSDDSTVTQPEAKYVFTGKQEQDDNGSSSHTHYNNAGGSIMGHSANFSVTMTKDQARRLRLVSSQAILFVVSYVLCQVWTGVTGILEDQGDSVEEELDILVQNYPLFVLQAIFSPLQGLLNLIVFIRPKYLKYRHLHKGESRLWVVRRSIFGEQVRSTIHYRDERNKLKQSPKRKQQFLGDEEEEKLQDGVVPSLESNEGEANNASPSITRRLPKNMVSDLTASQGDFDHVMQDEDDERWQVDKVENSKNKAPLASYRKRSSLLLCTSSALDVISENEESFFEAVPVLPGSEDLMIGSTNMDGLSFSPKSVNQRWSSGSVHLGDGSISEKGKAGLLSLALPIPARLESTKELGAVGSTKDETPSDTSEDTTESTTSAPEEEETAEGNSSSRSRDSLASLDRPIQIPQRRMSPPPASFAPLSDVE